MQTCGVCTQNQSAFQNSCHWCFFGEVALAIFLHQPGCCHGRGAELPTLCHAFSFKVESQNDAWKFEQALKLCSTHCFWLQDASDALAVSFALTPLLFCAGFTSKFAPVLRLFSRCAAFHMPRCWWCSLARGAQLQGFQSEETERWQSPVSKFLQRNQWSESNTRDDTLSLLLCTRYALISTFLNFASWTVRWRRLHLTTWTAWTSHRFIQKLVLTFVHLFVPVDVPRPDPKAEFGVLFGLWLVASVSQNLRLAEFACGFHFPCFIRFVLWNCSSSCPKRNCTATWCEKSSPFGLLGQFISPRTIPMSTFYIRLDLSWKLGWWRVQ